MASTAHRASHWCASRNSQRVPVTAAGVVVRLPRFWGKRTPAKPANEVTPDFITPFSAKPAIRSTCEAYRELIEQGLVLGRNGKAIWQDLVSDHGFAGDYQMVKRFVRKLRGPQRPEAAGIILTAPGEEAQVDYGSGPMVRDAQSSKYRRTRLFVLTLGHSRKSVRFFTGTRLGRLFLMIAAVIATFVRASGEKQPKILTVLALPQVVEKVLERNAQRKALQSYHCKRVYDLDYEGFPKALHGQMTVEMNYRAPDRKDFKIVSESGPKWLVNRVLRRLVETEREAQDPANRAKVELNPRNYDFTSLEHLANSDGCAYTLSVQPKMPSKFLYRGRIWVMKKILPSVGLRRSQRRTPRCG